MRRGCAVAIASARLAHGVDFDAATGRLIDEGVDKCVRPYDALLRAIERRAALGRAPAS